jgi:ubiquitin C-terminal hydrolase
METEEKPENTVEEEKTEEKPENTVEEEKPEITEENGENEEMSIEKEEEVPLVIEDKKSKLIYDLYGVVNHSGSLSFGHYYAYCKNKHTGKWYEHNDSSVSEMDES